jgi:hypothetical protein
MSDRKSTKKSAAEGEDAELENDVSEAEVAIVREPRPLDGLHPPCAKSTTM